MMINDHVIVIGVLFFAAVFLILSKTKWEMVYGVVIFSNAINLLLMVMSGPPEGKSPPIIIESKNLEYVDPLPQALVLTAIVIGFGLLALLIAMVYKTPEERDDASGK